MIQATIPAFCPDVVQDHRFKQLPFCSSCDRRFTEEEFLKLTSTGHNIIWDIEYAACPDCAGQVQGWLRNVQAWRSG